MSQFLPVMGRRVRSVSQKHFCFRTRFSVSTTADQIAMKFALNIYCMQKITPEEVTPYLLIFTITTRSTIWSKMFCLWQDKGRSTLHMTYLIMYDNIWFAMIFTQDIHAPQRMKPPPSAILRNMIILANAISIMLLIVGFSLFTLGMNSILMMNCLEWK